MSIFGMRRNLTTRSANQASTVPLDTSEREMVDLLGYDSLGPMYQGMRTMTTDEFREKLKKAL